jgi:hypothetical protein
MKGNKKMNIDQLFPRKYATGEDLKGKAFTATIAGCQLVSMRPNPQSGEVEKLVIHIRGAQKGIIASRTLAEQIAAALGTKETEEWTGKRVTLYPEQMKVAGVQRTAIRAKAAANGESPLPETFTEEEEEI